MASPDHFTGFLTGVLVMSVIFFIKWWLNNYDETSWCWRQLRSTRMVGYNFNTIVKGRWSAGSRSLWRTRDYQYFIMTMSEIEKRKLETVSELRAMHFTAKHGGREALRDWFGLENIPQRTWK